MKRFLALAIAGLAASGCAQPPPTILTPNSFLPPGPKAAGSAAYDRPPSLIIGQTPSYSGTNRLGGYADIEFTINVDGSTTDIRVTDTDDQDYAAAALEAVGGWRFDPARKEGMPVPLRVRQRIEYRP